MVSPEPQANVPINCGDRCPRALRDPRRRKAKEYTLEVPSDPATGFVKSQVHVADTPGYEPITADINVKKGVIITGRVIDAATKKPIPRVCERRGPGR